MVFDLLNSFKHLYKLDSISIDSNVFRLHYRATVLFLVLFSILVTSSQYFGDPIECIQTDGLSNKLLDTYCWIHSTFTILKALNKKVGEDVAAPGVDKFTPGEIKIDHKYYQWVFIVLLLQALMFYTPRYLWKLLERGKISNLVLGLNCPIMQEKEAKEQLQLLVQYLKANWNSHNTYFFCLIICELLNFMNVTLQIYLLDKFLDGSFSSYGMDFLRYSVVDQENRNDPMIAVFPRVTKCTFYQFGSSGDIQKHDTLCILPLNVVNEKIYIFLWFWFVFLAFLSGLTVLYRLVIIMFAKLRYLIILSRTHHTVRYNLRIIMGFSNLGDWFLLYQLCKNMDGQHFRQLLKDLSLVINEKGNEKNC